MRSGAWFGSMMPPEPTRIVEVAAATWPITAAVLAVNVEALRLHQVQRVARPRHGDVEQPALLLDLRRRARGHVRRDAAVDQVEDVDRVPFLALGGVDGGEDEVVLVQARCA